MALSPAGGGGRWSRHRIDLAATSRLFGSRVLAAYTGWRCYDPSLLLQKTRKKHSCHTACGPAALRHHSEIACTATIYSFLAFERKMSFSYEEYDVYDVYSSTIKI